MKPGQRRLIACHLAGSTLVALLPTAHVLAVETNYQLGYRLDYQSNIRRTATNPQEEWINVFSAAIQASENTASLNMLLDATLQRRIYANNTFADRTVADATGSLLWTIRPERFTWMVSDYLRETIIDPRNVDVPNNRQRTNTFTTGPDVIFRATTRDTLTLSHRFVDNYQEVTDIDSVQNRSTFNWQHRLSPISTLAAIVNYSDIDYDQDIYADRVINDKILRYVHTRPSINYQLDLGETIIRTDNAPRVDGSLRGLSINYNITATEAFTINLTDRLIEAGNLADAALDPGDALADGRFLTANVFRDKRSRIGYVRGGPFSTLTIGIYTATRNYFQDATLDNEIKGINFAFDYSVTETVQAFFNSNFNTRNYAFDGRELDTASLTLGASYQASHRLLVSGSIGTISRKSTVAGEEYDNFIASIGLTYSF